MSYVERSRATRTIRAKARAYRIQNALLSFYAVAAMAAGLMAVYWAQPVRMELAAYDAAGNRFVAGSGSDCPAAFTNARIPANWIELACEESR
jgi:hypothetical protein